jgi:hypothetical protein
VLLSVQSSNAETTFAVIFAIVSIGAIALTLNVLLLASACSPCPPPRLFTRRLRSRAGASYSFRASQCWATVCFRWTCAREVEFPEACFLGAFLHQVASILCLAWSNKIYQSVLLLVGAQSIFGSQRVSSRLGAHFRAGSLWSLRCSVPFVASTVSETRRALAVRPSLCLQLVLFSLAQVYPVLLLYVALGTLCVVNS